MGATPDVNLIDDLIRQRLDEILPQKLEEKLAERDKKHAASIGREGVQTASAGRTH